MKDQGTSKGLYIDQYTKQLIKEKACAEWQLLDKG